MTEQQDRRRWVVLAVGLLGLTAGSAAQYGLAVLIPALRTEGLSLETAALVVTAPIAGVLLTLIAWGAAADRWGERRILALGLAFAGVAELAVSTVDGVLERWLLLFVVGASSASVHAASGRLILGWFGPTERGLAMGIRQMGQPLGVASAAIVLAPLAVTGVGNAFVALGIASLAAATLVGLFVHDPTRQAHADGPAPVSPYRVPFLWRIHVASGFLVIPQYAISLFVFDYLVNVLGWSIAAAGALVAGTQLTGAATRLAVGWWSDVARSRLGPMRLVALAIGLAMTALSALVFLDTPLAVGALAVAAVVTVMPNGLAFTAVAERAGSRWAGRAMGIQNTFQNVFAAAVATPLALLIVAAGGGATGYALAYAAVVAFPFAAAVLIPVRSESVQAAS